MGHIYEIKNIVDSRTYIGSSKNIKRRWAEHKRDLLNNTHHNTHLQRFVNKYGINTLVFSVVEECEGDMILIREQYYLNNRELLFNISKEASAPMTNRNHSANSKRKISEANKGEKNSMYGKKRPKWIVDKLRESATGREKSISEKLLRLAKLPNRKELIITKDGVSHYCFSFSHAAKIIGVNATNIAKSIRKNRFKCKGWVMVLSDQIKFTEELVMNNINMFDSDLHPDPSLMKMLNDLQ